MVSRSATVLWHWYAPCLCQERERPTHTAMSCQERERAGLALCLTREAGPQSDLSHVELVVAPAVAHLVQALHAVQDPWLGQQGGHQGLRFHLVHFSASWLSLYIRRVPPTRCGRRVPPT